MSSLDENFKFQRLLQAIQRQTKTCTMNSTFFSSLNNNGVLFDSFGILVQPESGQQRKENFHPPPPPIQSDAQTIKNKIKLYDEGLMISIYYNKLSLFFPRKKNLLNTRQILQFKDLQIIYILRSFIFFFHFSPSKKKELPSY